MRFASRLLVLVVTVATAGLAGGSAHAQLTRSYECQHPMTTGQEAFNLHHIRPATACKAVRKLARYELTGRPDLIGCRGPEGHRIPYVKRHHFDGYRIELRRTYYFTMVDGRKWFQVGGTDFPYNCF